MPRTLSLLVLASALMVGSVGCGGGGGGDTPTPVPVDYNAFVDTLTTGSATGALSAVVRLLGVPLEGATVRIALPGAAATAGFVTQSAAGGVVRIGNVPGGTYELFLSAPGAQPKVVEVTLPAATITARTIDLDPVTPGG